MRTIPFVLCFVAALTLMSCATAPVRRNIVNSFEHPDDFDRVWSAVIGTMAEFNLSINAMEKASGLISTDWISFRGTSNDHYCDCGGLGLASEESREGKFNVFVRREGASTVVQVNTTYRQLRSFGSEYRTIDCVSTGFLEAQINESVQKKLTP